MRPLPDRLPDPPPSARAEGLDVAAAQDGDRAAFDRLAQAALPRLLGTARRLLRDEYAAEEAVAEALFRALTNLARFRGHSAFGTWLHRILCRVAADRFRHRARARRLEEALEREALRRGEGREDPARLDARGRIDGARAAAELLPQNQRLVLLLHAWEGLTLREVAETLGMRYATTKSHLHHARRALARHLGEDA